MRGFTLIEVMVSVAIFAVVMTVALGALLSMSESDRRAEALKTATNSLNFALDEMSRTARTGTTYDCNPILPLSGAPTATDCTAVPASRFAFTSSDSTSLGYCLGSTTPSGGTVCVGQTTCPAGIKCNISRYSGKDGTFLPITSSEVQISALSVYITGAAESPSTIQPKITILLTGFVNAGGTLPQTFNVESSVTQRIYDQ